MDGRNRRRGSDTSQRVCSRDFAFVCALLGSPSSCVWLGVGRVGPQRDPGWVGLEVHSGGQAAPAGRRFPRVWASPIARLGRYRGGWRAAERNQGRADDRQLKRESRRKDGGERERQGAGGGAKREGHWERKGKNEMQKKKPTREGEKRERMQ